MPTYAYECESCGHGFEKFQNMSASSLRKCPECGERKLQRLIGPGAGIIFKGSGFYETDYRSDSYKDGAKKDKPADSSGGKPEAKSGGSKSGDSKSGGSKSGDSKPSASKPKDS